MEMIQTELINLIIVILVACIGYLTRKITKYLNQKGANL